MFWFNKHYEGKLASAMHLMRREAPISPINAASLASLSDRAGESLLIFDLRDLREIEQNSCMIPGALLATNVNLAALVRWIPRETVVVFYAAEAISPHDSRLHFGAKKLKLYALEGGLRSWWKAGFPLEPVVLGDRRWADKN